MHNNQFDNLISKLGKLKSFHGPVLVAIDGIGGSGKSTLANQIIKEFKGSIISLDDFRSKEIYEVDRLRLIQQLLSRLKERKQAKYKKWIWGENKFSDWIEVSPEGFIIFEGVTSLHPELSDFYDFKIWIEIDEDLAFKRGLDRDVNEYNVDTESEWENIWIPYEQEYIRKYSPKKSADFIYTIT